MSVELKLREYQEDAVKQAINKIINDEGDFIVSAPTGSGKTEILIAIVKELQEMGVRSLFCADLTTIKTQTGARMAKYGMKYEYWLRNIPPSQTLRPIITTPQALARRRGLWPTLNVGVAFIDEAHVVYGSAMDFCDAFSVTLAGFTATPVTEKCIDRFQEVINVSSTLDLVAQNQLIFPHMVTGVAADMADAQTYGRRGDWRDEEKSTRHRRIVGQALDQWEEYGKDFFGYTPKTIMFLPTIDDCKQSASDLINRGYVAITVSADDKRTPEERQELFEFFDQKTDIDVLLSVKAIAKGADFPSVECLSMQNPYRKSHSSVIQQMGRVMRTAPGKKKALVIDNAENLQRFNATLGEFFRTGVNKLGDFREHVPKEFFQPEPDYCPQCGELFIGWKCVFCGFEDENKRKKLERISAPIAEVAREDGELQEIKLLTIPQMEEYIKDNFTIKEFYDMVLTYQRDRNRAIGRAYYVTLDVFDRKAPMKWARNGERSEPDPVVMTYLKEVGRRYFSSNL